MDKNYELFIGQLTNTIYETTDIPLENIKFVKKDGGDLLNIIFAEHDDAYEVCSVHVEELYVAYQNGIRLNTIVDYICSDVLHAKSIYVYDKTKELMDYDRHTVQHHIDISVSYDIPKYKDVMRNRWDPYKDEPIQQASQLCYILRRIVNTDESRVVALMEILEKVPKAIIFYNFDYEREMLLHLFSDDEYIGYEVAEWSGHAHQPVPDTKRWIYLVQYTAGCEGWNCIKTDTIIFFSQNYSYKVTEQACGRIDRLNTPFHDLYYYHLKSRSGIDMAITKALNRKKKFNERTFAGWD